MNKFFYNEIGPLWTFPLPGASLIRPHLTEEIKRNSVLRFLSYGPFKPCPGLSDALKSGSHTCNILLFLVWKRARVFLTILHVGTCYNTLHVGKMKGQHK